MENELASIVQCPENRKGELNVALKQFKIAFKKKWEASNRTQERFLQRNEDWLKETIKIPSFSSLVPGRPNKDFDDLSDRSKRRKTEELRKKTSAEELTFAASMSHRAARNPDAATMFQKITETPTRATKFKNIIRSSKDIQVKKHSQTEALSIFVEANLTRNQYEIIRSSNKNIYPSYTLIQRAKKECYPKEEFITVTKTTSEIRLQDIMDHTSSRL
jgi:hypothetical protein